MKTPGLPADYRLPLSKADLDDLPPADIGDFLDEDGAIAAAKNHIVAEPPHAPGNKVVGTIGDPRFIEFCAATIDWRLGGRGGRATA